MLSEPVAVDTTQATPVLCKQAWELIKQTLIQIATSIPDQDNYTSSTLQSLINRTNEALHESGLGDAVIAELLPALLMNVREVQTAWMQVKSQHFLMATYMQDADCENTMSHQAFCKLNLQELLDDVMYKIVTNSIENLSWRMHEKHSELTDFVAAIKAL